MSGWIKMGTGLASHPKVKALRRALKADRLKVIGGLWAVWCVFDEHSASGRLDGYTLDDMDEEIGWRGFSEAMRDIGWLIEDGDGLEAPDYEEHNGPNAKRRALDASRKGRTRAAKSDEEPPPDPPDERTTVRTKSGTVSASDADNLRNREEKRREEEKTTTPHPPAGGLAHADGSGTDNPEPQDLPPAVQVAKALRKAGIDANAHHPRLLALVQSGATVEEFLAFADKAKLTDNAFPYLLGCVEGERKRAAATAGQLHQGVMPGQAKPEDDPEYRTRPSVERLAEKHGLRAWDQCEPFPAYRQRVLQRAGIEPRRAA